MAQTKEFTWNAGDLRLIPGLGRSPGGGHGNLHQYSCLENPQGQRSLVGYSPWGGKESDATERLSRVQHSTCIYHTWFVVRSTCERSMGWFQFFTTESKTALIIFVYSNLCTCKFSFFWDNCQRVQLLCCMVIECKLSFFFFFFFKELPSCFPKWLDFLCCCIDFCLSLTNTTVLITVAL